MSRSPGSRRAPSRRGRLSVGLLALVVVGVLTLGAVAVGVLVGGGTTPAPESAPSPTPSPTGTPLGDVDTRVVAVARESFCAAVTPESVVRALGEVPGSTGPAGAGEVTARTWDNGQATRLESGLEDVAHEYGCAWRAPGGRVARAWVFTPPVTPAEARALSAEASRPDGCTRIGDAPAYGASSVSVSCTADDTRTRSWRGLFGDGWLTCDLSEPTQPRPALTPDVVLADRAGPWCAAVLAAAGAVPEPSGDPVASPGAGESPTDATSSGSS